MPLDWASVLSPEPLMPATSDSCRTVRATSGDDVDDHHRASAHHASFVIAAGVSLYELARCMGTSVEQIDRTYGHRCRTPRERADDRSGNRSGTGWALSTLALSPSLT